MPPSIRAVPPSHSSSRLQILQIEGRNPVFGVFWLEIFTYSLKMSQELVHLVPERDSLLPHDCDSSQITANARKPANESHDGSTIEKPASRYEKFLKLQPYLLGIRLVLIPLVMTGFYCWMCWDLILPTSNEWSRYSKHTFDQQWVYYLWFVVGVFGLQWSKDGLLGVEVVMLQSTFWRVSTPEALEDHARSLWSGPEGWLSLLVILFEQIKRKWREPTKERRYPSLLMLLLSVLSFLLFIGLTLSGITSNPTDGFILSDMKPDVVGRGWKNFNGRLNALHRDAIRKSWEIGSPTTIPGFGILYLPEYAARKSFDSLQNFPNDIPLDQNLPEMFLAPQAKNPVAGETWGLRASYNCSVVKDASEFTILTQKKSSRVSTHANTSETTDNWVKLDTPIGNSIYAFSTGREGESTNLWAYAEVGLTNATTTSFEGIYFGMDDEYFTKGASDDAFVVEYALWQVLLDGEFGDEPVMDFNYTLKPVVKGMPGIMVELDNGTRFQNESFFQVKNSRGEDDNYLSSYLWPKVNGAAFIRGIKAVAEPIGVRCRAASALGNANLDPLRLTFDSFKNSPPAGSGLLSDGPLPRLGFNVPLTLRQQYIGLFRSTASPAPLADQDSMYYEQWIVPSVLQKSLMRAFGLEALQLMYDGTYGFEGAWTHGNLTSSKEGKILGPGDLPFWVPLIFFIPWMIGSVLLWILYGPAKARLSHKLDEKSLKALRERLSEQ